MQIIKKFKSKFLKLGSDEDPLTFLIGLRFFQVGVLFLASAPIIAFLLLIFSSLITSFIKGGNYFRDKYNYPLIFISFLMIINCLFISFNNDLYSYNTSNIWIGLSNWIPFFWCFWGFQPYLKNSKLRIQISKIFIAGSLPVLISGFCQYFLKLYGPYNLFYNLIVWYQRPLGDASGVTGLFNNQNYAGAWLSIIFPLCLAFLISKNRFSIRNFLLFSISLSFAYMIILTSSRIAIVSIFFTLFLFIKSIKKKLLVLIMFFSVPLTLNLIPLLSLKIQSIIYDFLPYELIKKTSIVNIPSLNLFPRIEVWSKSLTLIKSNLVTGYGAGSFKSLYELSNGIYGDMQHSHNIFLEIAINHGLFASILILIMMLFLIIYSWIKNGKDFNNISSKLDYRSISHDRAWIISFMIFFLIHLFDITYFDGRISTTSWILLAGMKSMISEKKEFIPPS